MSILDSLKSVRDCSKTDLTAILAVLESPAYGYGQDDDANGGFKYLDASQLGLNEKRKNIVKAAQSASGQGVVTKEYVVEALKPKDFSFDRPVPAVKFADALLSAAGLSRSDEQLLTSKNYIVVGNEQSNIALDVTNFLRGSLVGDAEDSLHSRDDCLFRIMGNISGMPLQRNKVSDGSTRGARLDVYVGRPPCVVAEEKDVSGKLELAINECLTKIAWIPHYARLRFLIGVAFAGELVQFFTFNRQGRQLGVQYNLTRIEDRAKCVVAAINIGCYLKYIVEKNLVPAANLPFNRPVKDPEGRCQLTISWKQVDKIYFKMDDAERTRLKTFYKECRRVPYLERAQVVDEKGDRLRLFLTPVGLQRWPLNTDEAKVAIKCILTCLEGCHELGWALCDIRWPNIILLGDRTWCIIDAEMVRKMGEPLPAMKVAPPLSETVASASTDLFMVHKLLRELADTMDLGSDLQRLCKLLGKQEKRQQATAGALLQEAWLQAVLTPSSSPESAKSGERRVEQQASQHRQPIAPAGMQEADSSRASRAPKRPATHEQPGEDRKKRKKKKKKKKS